MVCSLGLARNVARKEFFSMKKKSGSHCLFKKKRVFTDFLFFARVIEETRKTRLMVEEDSYSEQEIRRSVLAQLRPGFPGRFRHLAQHGRKAGMRGKPTYFYSKVD